jgi:hypothetical protein
MAFGIDTGISRNTNNTVQVAEKLTAKGVIEDMHTHGGAAETTEEIYADSISNAALNGQSGTSVVTAHGLNETNVDYARATKTTRAALAAGA